MNKIEFGRSWTSPGGKIIVSTLVLLDGIEYYLPGGYHVLRHPRNGGRVLYSAPKDTRLILSTPEIIRTSSVVGTVMLHDHTVIHHCIWSSPLYQVARLNGDV